MQTIREKIGTEEVIVATITPKKEQGCDEVNVKGKITFNVIHNTPNEIIKIMLKDILKFEQKVSIVIKRSAVMTA